MSENNTIFPWTFDATFLDLADERDPVAATRKLLLGADASDWPGNTNPNRIERAETSTPSEKEGDQRRSQVSIYIQQTGDADYTILSAGSGTDATHVVDAAVWTSDESTAFTYGRAIQEIAATYATDNVDRSAFVDIFPDTTTDGRAGVFWSGGFAIYSVGIAFRGYRDASEYPAVTSP